MTLLNPQSHISPDLTPVSQGSIPTVLVMGGSGHIGRAICLQFGQAKWRVGVHYRERQHEAQETAHLCMTYGGESTIHQADVRDFQQVSHMLQNFQKQWGRLDVLVYSVGRSINNLVLRTSIEDWLETVETNLTGAFHALKAAEPLFQAQGDGAMVIIGSLSSLQGTSGQSAYAASKAGLLGLMKSVAREWGPLNIRVNAIFPGWQQSMLSGKALTMSKPLDNHILQRTSDIQEIAKTVYDLSQLQDVSGQIWNLDSRLY